MSNQHIQVVDGEPLYRSDLPAIATVRLNEQIRVDAVSVLPREFNGEERLPTTYAELKVPVTGPIAIEGVSAGDRVRINIIDIELATSGAMITLPGLGAYGSQVGVDGRVVSLVDGVAVLDKDVKVPVVPMVGKIALAPKSDAPPSSTVGDFGGNMDNKYLSIGSSILLKSSVDEAMLYLGDLHACQGDGESALTAVETSGTVTIQVETGVDLDCDVPVVVTPSHVMTIGSGESLDEAAADAALSMHALLRQFRGWTPEKAAMALSLIGDAGICQLVNPRKSARMTVPAHYLRELQP